MSSYTTDSYGAESSTKGEIDLIRLLGEMIDHRVIILSVTFLFAFLAALYASFSRPVYQADALIQIEAKQENGLLKNLSQLDSGLSPDVAPEILLLKSRMILGETVDDLGLTQHVRQRMLPIVGPLWEWVRGRKQGTIAIDGLHIPQLEGHPQELILTALGEGKYLLEGEDLRAQGTIGKPLVEEGVSLLVTALDAVAGTQFTLKSLPRLDVIHSLQKRLTVTESAKQSGMLTLTLTGHDAENIAVELNTIAESYLRQNVARQQAQDARSLAFLQRQLPKISSELNEAEARLNEYRKQRDSVDLTLEAKSVLDRVVNVENQLNELTFREAEISQLFKKDHPTYRALQDKRKTLEQERARLNGRVSSMPSTQQEILRLSRDVESGREIYLQLLTRQQELSISRSSAIGNVRIIDAAVTKSDPIKPKKALIVVMGVLLGLMMSAGGVLVRVALKRGITTSEQLEVYGIPVLATLPRSAWLWKKTHLHSKTPFNTDWRHKTSDVPFLPVDRPADMFVEAIRGLRTSLHFTMMDAVNKVVMFSGPTQDCGKTLVSTSLAAVTTQAGQKTLLIDADMRAGYVDNIFNLSNSRGLSSVLEGTCGYREAIQHYEKGGFDVMTRGPDSLLPSELLLSERLQALMAWADEHYDMVIVDTPPVLAVTDAALIAKTAATLILVTRFDKTSAKEVETSIKRLQQLGVRISGILLNDIVKSAALYYSSGYNHSGYSYTAENKSRER